MYDLNNIEWISYKILNWCNNMKLGKRLLKMFLFILKNKTNSNRFLFSKKTFSTLLKKYLLVEKYNKMLVLLHKKDDI